VLAADNRAVFTAAAHAQRAAEFINRKATASAQVNSTCSSKPLPINSRNLIWPPVSPVAIVVSAQAAWVLPDLRI